MKEFEVWAVDMKANSLDPEEDETTIYYQRIAGIHYWSHLLPKSGGNQPQDAPAIPSWCIHEDSPYKVRIRYSPEVLEIID